MDYLNWRYVSIPDIQYSIRFAEKNGELLGYMVMRVMTWEGVKIGVIFDLISISEAIDRCLLIEAINHCRREKTDLAYSRTIANSSYIRACKKSGFISVPFAGSWFTTFPTPGISDEFLLNRDNWYVQMGDSDFL